MCINVLEHAVQNFSAIFSVFFLAEFQRQIRLRLSRFANHINLKAFPAIHNSTTIADKLMKFAGQLALVVLIKGCLKHVISEQ